MKFRHDREREIIQLHMTPMIDIVFQLLVFFIMTFKIVAMEGDFSITMPLSAPREGPPEIEPLVPMKLRMTADASGDLVNMSLGENNFGTDLVLLRTHIRRLMETDAPGMMKETAEIELDFDFHLRYRHVIDAITAVSGYVVNGQTVTLIENIKLAPPRDRQ